MTINEWETSNRKAFWIRLALAPLAVLFFPLVILVITGYTIICGLEEWRENYKDGRSMRV